MKDLKEWMEEREKGVKILIKGILTKIGKERGKIEKGNVEKEERKKNIRVNGERKRLCRF